VECGADRQGLSARKRERGRQAFNVSCELQASALPVSDDGELMRETMVILSHCTMVWNHASLIRQ